MAGKGGELSFLLRMPAIALLMASCEAPPNERNEMPGADPARGRQVIVREACASCHRIPGIDWPRGSVGPPLNGFAGQQLIAGRFPNRPDNAVRFLREAPALLPGTLMPAYALSDKDARDAAAYLYTLDAG